MADDAEEPLVAPRRRLPSASVWWERFAKFAAFAGLVLGMTNSFFAIREHYKPAVQMTVGLLGVDLSAGKTLAESLVRLKFAVINNGPRDLVILDETVLLKMGEYKGRDLEAGMIPTVIDGTRPSFPLVLKGGETRILDSVFKAADPVGGQARLLPPTPRTFQLLVTIQLPSGDAVGHQAMVFTETLANEHDTVWKFETHSFPEGTAGGR